MLASQPAAFASMAVAIVAISTARQSNVNCVLMNWFAMPMLEPLATSNTFWNSPPETRVRANRPSAVRRWQKT